MTMSKAHRAVFDAVASGAATTAPAIAEATGMAPKTVGARLSQLAAAGYLRRDRRHRSGVGRPPQPYEVVPWP